VPGNAELNPPPPPPTKPGLAQYIPVTAKA
jgi:hypothetical protein